jgi:2-hydroxy-3-oxopropionate reductase
MAKVAFIGLGVMGYPMAGHLAKHGHEVTVYNRTQAKATSWLSEYQGQSCETPKAAAQGKEFVFVCVGNDDDLRQVVLSDTGVLAGMDPKAVLVDHTTASADIAREIGLAAGALGIGFLDAPVSGGQAGAENGVLTVMVGGGESTFAATKPVIMSYAKCVELLGDVGAGQLTKMVNQICIAGGVQGLAEALHFARSAGLDAKRFRDCS